MNQFIKMDSHSQGLDTLHSADPSGHLRSKLREVGANDLAGNVSDGSSTDGSESVPSPERAVRYRAWTLPAIFAQPYYVRVDLEAKLFPMHMAARLRAVGLLSQNT